MLVTILFLTSLALSADIGSQEISYKTNTITEACSIKIATTNIPKNLYVIKLDSVLNNTKVIFTNEKNNLSIPWYSYDQGWLANSQRYSRLYTLKTDKNLNVELRYELSVYSNKTMVTIGYEKKIGSYSGSGIDYSLSLTNQVKSEKTAESIK